MRPCGKIEYFLPIPDVEAVRAENESIESLSQLFLGQVIDDPADLGREVRVHPLTHAVLDAAGAGFVAWDRLRELVFQRAPHWGKYAISDPAGADQAIGRFLALLSHSRRRNGDKYVPRFLIEIQLWVRELSRLQQAITPEAGFAWMDAPDGEGDSPDHQYLPAIYCRECGRTGWYVRQTEAGAMDYEPKLIYQAMAQNSRQLRALIRADVGDNSAHHLHIADRSVRRDAHADGGSVPVLYSPEESDAKAERCPSCLSADAIRPIGSRIATLASVAIGQVFGSPTVDDDQRKLLVFTDSVQDASHRSSFFMGRTFRFNFRTALTSAISDSGGIQLFDVGKVLLGVDGAEAKAARRFTVAPPELVRDRNLDEVWEPDFEGDLRDLQQRLTLEATLEFGIRSRAGRTLELSGVAAGVVDLGGISDAVALLREGHAEMSEQLSFDRTPDYEGYLVGILERMRRRGSIYHRWLKTYIENDRRWHVWGGRFPKPWMPAFPPGVSAPAFPTFGASENFDAIGKVGPTPTWWLDWTNRLIGESHDNAELAKLAFRAMTQAGLITAPTNTTFALDPKRVRLVSTADVDVHAECGACGDRIVGPEAAVDLWADRPCLRYRCTGRYEPHAVDDDSFYKRLYTSGNLRRVVAAEHTGLLERADREALETSFKRGTSVTDPNVIAATPTLELGIDIGDLSVVMLAGVPPKPANYTQRVGRAGRSTGNALVVTFAGRRARDLHYLDEPLEMIEGDVRAPDAFLAALGILRRQFAAYVLDRVADRSIEFDEIPGTAAGVFTQRQDRPSWLDRLAGAVELRPTLVDGFLGLFPDLDADVIGELKTSAIQGFVSGAKLTQETWNSHVAELRQRTERINSRIRELEQQSHLSRRQKDDLDMLRGERKAVGARVSKLRGEYGPSALQRYGLLPNYTLYDDAVELSVNLWRRTGEGDQDFDAENLIFGRSGRLALREFAPGNTFYAHGHKLRVDSLQLGGPQQAGYEELRICPACGFSIPADELGYGSCPRCNDTRIGDQGAVHTALRVHRGTHDQQRGSVAGLGRERRAGPSVLRDGHHRGCGPHRSARSLETCRGSVRRGAAQRRGHPHVQLRAARRR